MSKLTSLVVSLVLGGSSVAMAAPTVTYTPAPAPIAKGDGFRGDGHQLPGYGMPQRHTWDLLGSARMTNRFATVDVSSNERYQKLELRAARFSSMDVARVQIKFASGETQTIRLNQKLYAGKPIVIDLEGRRGKKIDKVTVVGDNAGWRAGFSVLAI
jgi:hypothetical protein